MKVSPPYSIPYFSSRIFPPSIPIQRRPQPFPPAASHVVCRRCARQRSSLGAAQAVEPQQLAAGGALLSLSQQQQPRQVRTNAPCVANVAFLGLQHLLFVCCDEFGEACDRFAAALRSTTGGSGGCANAALQRDVIEAAQPDCTLS
jgi:hypothetical protein